MTFNLWQIEAIAHDEAAQGCISGFDALNIRLENQVNHLMYIHLLMKGIIHYHFVNQLITVTFKTATILQSHWKLFSLRF